MAMIEAHNFDVNHLARHYAAVRKRLYSPPPRPAPVAPPPRPVVAVAPKPAPKRAADPEPSTELCEAIRGLSAVLAFATTAMLYTHGRTGCPGDETAEIFRQISVKHGVTVDAIRGVSRMAPIVKARQEAYYRLRAERPLLSLSAIARMFRRDHTTILAGIAKYASDYDLPIPGRTAPNKP